MNSLLKKERIAPALLRLRAFCAFSRPRPGSGMAAARMRWLRRGCRKTARRITRRFGTLWGASFRAFPAPLPHFFRPLLRLFSAPGSIAAKPQKPCDGGVFRALNLLLKKERIAPALLRLRACRTFSRPRPGSGMAAERMRWLRRGCRKTARRIARRVSALLSAPFPSPSPRLFSAPGSIAAKPQKPCDGGVFRALNLLLFL